MLWTRLSTAILLSLVVYMSNGFVPKSIMQHHNVASLKMTTSSGQHHGNEHHNNEGEQNIFSRRKVITDTVFKSATVASILSSVPTVSIAEEGEEVGAASVAVVEEMKAMGKDEFKPISIIGAGGKVGGLCTGILNEKGLYTRAITRSGRKIFSEESNLVSYASGDVTNYEAIKKAVEGSSGVIFAASASGKKKGGDPEHVDYLGLYNTAKVCFEHIYSYIFL